MRGQIRLFHIYIHLPSQQMLTYSSNLQYGTQITLIASYWHKSHHWRFSKNTAQEVWEDPVCAREQGEGERGKGRTDGRRKTALAE